MAAKWINVEESLTATGIADVVLQIFLGVVTRDLAASQELFEIPTRDSRKSPGLAKRQDATFVQGQSQFFATLSRHLSGRQAQSIDDVVRYFQHYSRHGAESSSEHR